MKQENIFMKAFNPIAATDFPVSLRTAAIVLQSPDSLNSHFDSDKSDYMLNCRR